MRLGLVVITVLLFVVGCSDKFDKKVFIDPNSALIKYTGRINVEIPSEPVMYWSGTEIEVDFQGDSLKIMLEDEKGENYFNVVIDRDSLRYLKLDSGSAPC